MTELLSVIIPTYRDWERLRLCLDALRMQSLSKEYFEVIVVNNDQEGMTPSYFELDKNVKIISELIPGSYNARNAALNVAQGEILVFTDSDCIPDKYWLELGRSKFIEGNAKDRLAGKIELFFESETPSLADLYESIFAFDQKSNVKSGSSVTANLFVRRSVFLEVGGFDGLLKSGGDYEWNKRATKSGFGISYSPDVIVRHPTRSALKELVKKARRVEGGKVMLKSYSFNTIKQLKDLIYDLRPPLKDWKVVKEKGIHLSIVNQIQIFLIRYYIRVVRAIERYKVLNGKEPSR